MADIGFKNVLIMEEIVRKKNLDFSSLDDKFEWIVEEFKPTLFLALFHKKEEFRWYDIWNRLVMWKIEQDQPKGQIEIHVWKWI